MSVPPPRRRQSSPDSSSRHQTATVRDSSVGERGSRRSASLTKSRSGTLAKSGLLSRLSSLGSRAGALSSKEAASGQFSDVREVPLDMGMVQRVAIIASRAGRGRITEQPTLLAVSGEEQRHVSKFFRAWLAEDRGWQVLVPLRREGEGQPYLFDAEGVDSVVQLMQNILEARGEIAAHLPHRVESGKLHLVGTSNGGATVLAAACRVPHLVASLTLVTGFIPKVLEDVTPLRDVPSIRLFAGDRDSFGHDKALEQLQQFIEEAGGRATLKILPGTTHMSIGKDLDLAAFWKDLEAMRNVALASKVDSQMVSAETVAELDDSTIV